VQMVAAWIAPRSVRSSGRLRRTCSLSRRVVPTTVATRPTADAGGAEIMTGKKPFAACGRLAELLQT